jgi:hypothetical protein
MTRTRWIIAISAGAVLAALLGWQFVREQKVAACRDAGGIWDGQRSRCIPALKPIIQRDLQRS